MWDIPKGYDVQLSCLQFGFLYRAWGWRLKLGSEERAEEGVGSSKCCHFSASSSTPCSVSDLESGWVGTRKEDEEEYTVILINVYETNQNMDMEEEF